MSESFPEEGGLEETGLSFLQPIAAKDTRIA
jgi:hypothetical protein